MTIIENLTQSAQGYSAAHLIGFMTMSLMLAMVLIALGVRTIRAMLSAQEYEQAMRRVEEIEQKLHQAIEDAEAMREDYERAMTDMKEEHDREVFSLQQAIFERNSEILDLKTDLLELSKHYGNYHYDTLPQ